MSALAKLLPVAALGIVGAVNSDALKKNLGVIQEVRIAATSGIEMRGIADAVAQQMATDETLPIANFSEFLKDAMMEKGGKETRDKDADMWGTPYRILVNPPKNGFEIWSAGPDTDFKTEDDLKYLYVLTGIAGKQAITPEMVRQAQLVQARYNQEDQAQESGSAGSSASQQRQQTASRTKARPSNNDRERRRAQSQKDRAESGSATAQLSYGERLATGDEYVEKDLDAAKAMLEEAAENLDSSILKRKAKSILDRIAVEQN
tara:strand:+ start:4106 stop:4891 length:786 start_codon:yes stop_codon:yes gene_type:complete